MSDIKKLNERLSKKSENFSLHEIISRNKIITIHFSEVQIIQKKEGDDLEVIKALYVCESCNEQLFDISNHQGRETNDSK